MRDLWSNFSAKRESTKRRSLHIESLESRSLLAVVGYYDMVLGQGNSNQVAPITATGNTPQFLTNLTAGDLAGIDVLFVQNPSNSVYGSEYVANLSAIDTAVSGGMTLIIHDRYVDPAETILPGGAGFDIVRDFTDGANIDVTDDTTLITNGPGGIVDNSTLDGGGFSSHGYTIAGTLPAGSKQILSQTDSTHIVTFSYGRGNGFVVYSSIPLDYYLNGIDPAAFRTVYAPNVVAYGRYLTATTHVDLTGGNVTVTDVGAATNDDIHISVSGANLQIVDASSLIVGGPGTTQVDDHTVRIPLASVSGQLIVNTFGGNDRLTVDFSGGNPIPAGGVSYSAGEEVGDDDSIRIQGYSLLTADGTADVTVNHTDAEAGDVVFAGLGTISFAETEPLILAGDAADLVINLPAGPTTDALIGDDGPANFPADPDGNTANTSAIDASTFEFTQFTNPTNSLEVNLGAAGDTITVIAMDAAFAPAQATDAFEINGGAGADTFNVQAAQVAGGGAFNGLTLDGNGGVDTFNVSSNAPANTGNLDAIDSLVTVIGGGQADVLNISESGIAVGDTVSVYEVGVEISGTAGGGWTVDTNGDILAGGINILTGSGADNITVFNSFSGEPITINANGGVDTIAIDSNGAAAGGVVDDINSLITVNGGGQAGDSVTLQDSSDVSADTVSFNPSTNPNTVGAAAGDTFFGTGGSLAYSGLSNINLQAPSSTAAVGDVVNVRPQAGVTFTLDGNDPAGLLPGDVLSYDGTGTKGIGPAAGGGTITGPGVGPVIFTEFETVAATGGNFLSDTIDIGTLPGGADGNPNILRLDRDPTGLFLQIFFDGDTNSPPGEVLISTQLYATVGPIITVNGAGDNDTLIVDHSLHFINRTINFSGAGQTGAPGDALVLTGDPGAVAARATYLVGASQDAGIYVIDPDGSKGAGATGASSGDEMIVNFTGLEPIDDDVPAAIFDVILSASADVASIDDGGTINGANALQITDLGGTFETTRFANKTLVRIMGASGADRFRLNYTTPAAGLTTLEVYGHVALDVAGQPADDNLDDNFELDRAGGSITNRVFGQGGSDGFSNDAQVIVSPLFGVGPANLDLITGTLEINGGTGGANGAADSARLHDFNDVTADTVVLDSVSPTIGRITGATSATITHTNLDSILFEGSRGGDTINVLTTIAGTSYYVTGNGGPDTVTIGNTAAGFAVPGSGNLEDILGEIIVTGEFNPPSPGAVDTLNIDASGDAALAGAATIGINPAYTTSFFATIDNGAATELLNFAPAAIRYRHTFSTTTTPDAVYNNRIEFVNILGSLGADDITVDATTATDTTTLNTRQGNDTVTISGDNLSANNLFQGFDGNDEFTLNITAHLGETSFAPIESLQIEGNAPAADTNNRDRVTINDDNGGFVRELNYQYLATQGDLDIEAAASGAGLAGGNSADMAVNIRSMETLIFNSAGTNDLVTVTGTPVDDDLTVALLPTNAALGITAASSALVFLNGNPYISAPPATLAGNRPGISGGGSGVDMLINGVDPFAGIALDGAGTGAIGNRAIVQAASENAVLIPGGTNDVFGFGVGVLIPGFGAGDAYDTIFVNDFVSGPNRVATFNNSEGSLLPVELINTPSFANGTSNTSRAGLIVNGGDEAVAQPNGISDDFFVTPHPEFNIAVNGNLPELTFGPDGFPVGDQLTLFSPTSFSIWSDKSTPPNVTTLAGNDSFGVIDSSIERTRLFPGNGVINLIGDDNDPTVDQTDNFVVVGREVDQLGSLDAGYQEAFIVVNGSGPILVDGMQFLNAYGFDLQGEDLTHPGAGAGNDVPATATTADDIDTLEITAYADNSANPPNNAPRGWGIDVFYNEGVPAQADGAQQDLLIYHTSQGLGGGASVSEDIVIVPSGPENGEIRATNSVDGSVIVVIQYVDNTDIVVVDDDGGLSDTDTLTLRGTNPDAAQTSGNELITVDFDAAGNATAPFVTVTDADSGSILYRLRSFTDPTPGAAGPIATITFEMLGGDDTLVFRAPADSAFRSGVDRVNVRGGLGDDTLVVDLDARDLWREGRLFFDGGAGADALAVIGTPSITVDTVTYTPGPNPGDGRLEHSDGVVQVIDFVNLEPVVDLVPAATLVVNANNADNAINYSQGSVAANGLVSIDAQETIEFSNKTTLTINALAGSDTININNPTRPTALTAITVNGGDPTNSDTVIVNAQAGVLDPMVVEPTAQDAGTVVYFLGNLPNVAFTGAEHLSLVGQAADGDTFGVDGTIGDDLLEYLPGATPHSGTIIGTMDQDDDTNLGPFPLVPVSFSGMVQGSLLRFNSFGQVGGTDTFVYNGTSAIDNIGVGPGPFGVSITNSVNGQLFTSLDADNMSSITVQSHDGDDNITVSPITVPLTVDGGNPSGSDLLTVNAPTATIDFATSQITFPAPADPISFDGIESLRLNGTIGVGDGFSVLNYGVTTDVDFLELNTANQIAIRTGDAPNIAQDTLRFSPYTNRNARMERAEGGPIIDILQFNPDTAVNVGAATQGADDRLEVIGGHDRDRFRVFRTQPAPGDAVRVETTLAIGTADETNGVPIIFQTSVESLALFGRSGADIFLIDEVNGLIGGLSNGPGSSTILRSGIVVDGGDGSDRLEFAGAATVDAVYSPGPVFGQGFITHSIGDNTQLVHFYNLEPVFDPVPGPLVVIANNADNAINYSQGSVAANGLVSIDAQETIEFTNKTTLTINALAGSDTININNPTTPTGLTGITVNGGDPTASDTVIVNGTGDSDLITVDEFTLDGATVTGAQPVPVTVTTTEHLTIVGQGGGDSLTVSSPIGGSEISLSPGETFDAGSITHRGFVAGTSLLPLDYTTLGIAGSLTFDVVGGGRSSGLDIHGTDSDDQFNVTATATGTVQIVKPTFGVDVTVPVNTTGVVFLRLIGKNGDDIFNVPGDHPIPVGINIQGGDPSASDVLNFTGTGGLVTVETDLQTVTEAGFGPVLYSGIEEINVDAASGPVDINGSLDDDAFTVRPNDATGAEVTLAGLNTVFQISNTLDLEIDGDNGGGFDNSVTVIATEGDDVIGVTGATVSIAGRLPVNLVDIQQLSVIARAGDDTIDVTPSATTTIFVDGGDPIGSTPGDRIVLHPPGAFTVEPGPESDEGGLNAAGVKRVSWDHIEGVTAVGGPGVGPAFILGTNGDDDITIIARDSSTHAGSDGVQDFTVSVNDGVDVLFLNVPVFLVDALAGDDDIVVREPAPNSAVWNVQLFIAGGTPASPTGDQGDVVELETPGTQTVIFTPNPVAFAIPILPAGITLTLPVLSGIDTAIINDVTNASVIAITPFTLSILGVPFVTSSPGGAEQIIYQGLAGGDNLTINGTSADDTTTINPIGAGSGSFRSGLSPTFDYTGATAVTVTGGTGGFDRVIVNGTEGPDTVTSTAAVITFGGTVTLGAGLDRLDINTFGGDDSIVLALAVPGLEKFIDAGAGNDIVNLSAVAVDPADPTIFGGDGDDLLIGSPNPDLIFGGRGNDILIGGGGADVEYGEEGNDLFGDQLLGVGGISNGTSDDSGADQLFGGSGSDRFVWDPGDGSDTIEGGAGESDQMIFFGSAGAEIFTFTQVGTRLSFTRNLGGIVIDAAGIDQVTLQTGGGADVVVVNDVFQTDVRVIDINLANADGSADAAVDTTTVNGREVSDNVSIASPSAGVLAVTGLRYDVLLRNAAPADDIFNFNANGGNDTVVAADDLSVLFASANFTINGGLGDDFLSGFGTLSGGDGDDTLIGSSVAQAISGGAGDDTIRGNGGVDTLSGDAGEDTFLFDFDAATDVIDGGADFDTILISGTSGNDTMTANQTAAVTLVTSLNAATETDTLVTLAGVRTVERVRIEAQSGDDTIFVTHLDALNDAVINSVLFDVDGGRAFTRDRLSVQDNGTGDLVLYRKGESDDNGSISVGPGNAESLETVFSGIEFVQPVAGVGGLIRTFKHDPLEWNDDLLNATFLGANDSINVDPNIEPGPLAAPAGFAPLPGDQDWFRLVAETTGTLDLQVYFTQIATVPSGRPGLPNAGNLDIELYDVDGTLIVDGVAGGVTPEFGLNDATDNERIRIPAVAGQTYYLRVFGNGVAVNTYNITAINTAAPVPFDIELLDAPLNIATNSTPGAPGATAVGLSSDTGRSRFDDITYDNDPTILIRVPNVVQVLGVSFLEDIPANGSGAPGSPPDETILIPFIGSTLTNAPSAGFRVAVFVTENNTTDAVLAGYAQPIVGRPGVFTFTFANDALAPDGSYFISSSVEMIDPTLPDQNQGFGELAKSLEAIIDTIPPPASFGSPGVANDGLILSDDCPTIFVNLTNVARPTFWGRAEANAVINLFLDSNANGLFDPATDVFLGQTVATPFDGGDQYPNGYWEIESRISLNDPSLVPPLPFDGPRTLFITAEDVAGNITGSPGATVATTLQIVIDTQGPQITDVDINNAGNPYDLFDPKPSTDGPTPLVNSLVISLRDLPLRVAGTLFATLAEGSDTAGLFQLVGDYNGIIPIQQIIVVNNPPVAGQAATATIELVFRTPGPDGIFNTPDDVGNALPDDRFTLIVSDEITDPLCNRLDGESNASEPHENPTFPSGNGVAGGDFVARFTVDSRAEIGTWGAGAAWIDTNGNTTFDQDNADYTNRDITYYMGFTSDNLFAGNFVRAAGGVADGFDKLAAYGRVGQQWRFLVDVDNDGVITPGVDISIVDPAGINGVPVAGNFDGNLANGDEVGVFTGTNWYFDTNHDFKLDLASAVPWSQHGHPVVGNFDGVAGDDLATYRDNTFFIDFGRNGSIDRTFRFGFPTPNNRPISADVDRDGHDDLGLFVPNRAGVSPDEDAEWYILVSGGARIVNRIHADPIDGVPVINFKPVPFGKDIYCQYGDQFGLPILANFDPPVVPGGETSVGFPAHNSRNPLDVNNDGYVTAIDALLVINDINENGSHAVDSSDFQGAPFRDVDRDNVISPRDALLVINHLNQPAAGQSGAEGEGEDSAHETIFSELGRPTLSASTFHDVGLLSLLADEQVRAKRARRAE